MLHKDSYPVKPAQMCPDSYPNIIVHPFKEFSYTVLNKSKKNSNVLEKKAAGTVLSSVL